MGAQTIDCWTTQQEYDLKNTCRVQPEAEAHFSCFHHYFIAPGAGYWNRSTLIHLHVQNSELRLIMIIRYYHTADAGLSTISVHASELLPGSVILLEPWGEKVIIPNIINQRENNSAFKKKKKNEKRLKISHWCRLSPADVSPRAKGICVFNINDFISDGTRERAGLARVLLGESLAGAYVRFHLIRL